MGGESDQAKALTAMTLERDNAVSALTAMSTERDNATIALEAMTAERDTAASALTAEQAATAQAKADLQDSQSVLETVRGELDTALSSLESERKQRTDLAVELGRVQSDLVTAKRKASVTQKAKPSALRDVVEQDGVDDKQALLETLRSGLHDVVFSDGAREIPSLAPISVGPEAWQLIGRGVLLREPVTILPDRAIQLGGFGLFDAEGKQIAWCAMAQPVTIAAGQPMRLDRQIVF